MSTNIGNKRVLVAMSGGVDSSVAALLLHREGYGVVGLTMCFGLGELDNKSCCNPKAIKDAKKVCDTIGIAHHVLDFSIPFKKVIIDSFVNSYALGRTPNPCVRCNTFIKFDLLLEKARAMGFEYIATGHYAKIEHSFHEHLLLRPADRKKDQTYFLYGIKRENLSSIIFPLSKMNKSEVRRIAMEEKLPVAEKAESQDICFISGNNYREFIRKLNPSFPGPIVDTSGRILGQHCGLVDFTIGQRKKLGIASGKPLYVVSIDNRTNTVVVGSQDELLGRVLKATDVNMLVDRSFANTKRLTAKIRYSHEPSACIVSFETDGTVFVEFEQPQRAITPGQSVVFYADDVVVGGGIIDSVLR